MMNAVKGQMCDAKDKDARSQLVMVLVTTQNVTTTIGDCSRCWQSSQDEVAYNSGFAIRVQLFEEHTVVCQDYQGWRDSRRGVSP